MKRFGYRTEDAYGSGIRDIKEIIFYETVELGNSDIFRYCFETYDLSEELTSELDDYAEMIDNCEEVSETDIRWIINELIMELKMLTSTEIKYGLWLADKKTVKELYDGNDENIDKYPLGQLKLSDLGSDGVLYGYSELPKKL